jgi:predicted acylesterase/phospholipase RssA
MDGGEHETGTTGQELRLGVVMTGGVSLAVWMGGVTHELDRLRRGADPYEPMLDTAQLLPVVDVTVGTSAGGLNGTVLASAEAWGSQLTLSDDPTDGLNMRAVWANDGDLGLLLRGAGDQDPPSLLRGDGDPSFLQSVADALATLSKAKPLPTDAPDPQVLPRHLIATTTLWTGDKSTYEDSLGTEVPVQTSLGLFHFRRDADIDHFGETPDARATAVGRLARAARSSASFPFAFEPAMINVSDPNSEPYFGGTAETRIADFSRDTFVLDGGLVDNEPLQQCLNLIEQQPATQPVTRVVVFVAPLADPGGSTPPSQTTTPTLLEVGKKALFIPRDRDIEAQLDEISVRRIHQERLANVSKTLVEPSDDERDGLAALTRAGGVTSSFQRHDRLDRATTADLAAADAEQQRLQLKQAALNVNSLLGRALTESTPWTGLEAQRRKIAEVIRIASSPTPGDLDALWDEVGVAFEALVAQAPGTGTSEVAREVVTLDAIGRQVEPAGRPGQVRASLLALELLQSMVTDPQVRSPQQIQFVEISSATPNCFDGRATSTAKLTGAQFDHFGAFYLSSWRMNDWMWGRLDAAWRLTELLLDLSGQARTPDDVKRVARPIQLEILREELPAIGDAIKVNVKEGSTASVAEETFLEVLRQWGASPSDDLVERTFRACTVGTERFGAQAGSEHFATLVTQAGSVLAGALAAQPQAKPIKPALTGIRSVLRGTNMLVRRTSSSSPTVFALVGFVAAAAGSLLGVGIAHNNTALALACGVTLLALLLASIFRAQDAFVEVVGALGAFGLLVLSIAALARGATAAQVLGAALGALAGLLLVGLLLPSESWRRVIAAVGLLALAAAVGTGIWVWSGNTLFVSSSLEGQSCSIAPTTSTTAKTAVTTGVPAPSTGPCTELYHAGVKTGALIVGAGAIGLLVAILFCVLRLRRRRTTADDQPGQAAAAA